MATCRRPASFAVTGCPYPDEVLPADIYVEKRRIGSTFLVDDFLWEHVKRPSLSTAPQRPRKGCPHADVLEGFAYVDAYNQHWPVLMCRDCRTILAGRCPYAFKLLDSPLVGDPALAELILAKWNQAWPRDGKPRTKKHPAGLVWPESVLSEAA